MRTKELTEPMRLALTAAYKLNDARKVKHKTQSHSFKDMLKRMQQNKLIDEKYQLTALGHTALRYNHFQDITN